MSWVAIAVAGAGVAGAVISSNASQKAADTQAGAADRTAALEKEMYDKNVQLQEPFRQSGLSAQNKILDLLGLSGNTSVADYGKYAKNFSEQDFQADPGYGFRLSEGLKSLDRTASARGGLLSGANLKAAQRYGQDLASQEYQNAFNRYQINRSNMLNPLQSLSGQGITAANTIGNYGANYATGAGNAYIDAANARASGYVGSANSITNAINQGLNYYQNQQLLNSLNK